METRAGFPFRFECRRSGNCCAIPGGIVRVTKEEAATIAAHLGMTPAAFASRYLQPDGERLKDGLGNRCVFLRDGVEASCGIYPVRPQKCHEFPFWPELRTDEQLRQFVQRTCPGIRPLDGHDERGAGTAALAVDARTKRSSADRDDVHSSTSALERVEHDAQAMRLGLRLLVEGAVRDAVVVELAGLEIQAI